jgi:hypothetical protein
MANVNRSQIEITETHYNIKSIPITVDDAVMNKVHYSDAENKKGMPSMKGNPVTLGHPVIDGVNVSARSGEGLAEHFSGGTIKRVYNKSDVWYADASIKKSVLNAQEGGPALADRLDNEESIAVSTGLEFEVNDISGVNKAGVPFSHSAINQNYDHLAMLAKNQAPAGGDDTVMRFNVADVMLEGEADNENVISRTWNAIKSIFGNGDHELSHDEIQDKIHQKLNEGRSDDQRHLWPREVFDTHFIYSDENGTMFKQAYAISDDEVIFIGERKEGEMVFKETTNNNGDSTMLDRKQVIALLAGKNISVNADISDADLEAKLTEAINAKADPAPNVNADDQPKGLTLEDVTKAINAGLKPLQEQLTANADKELETVVAQVVALNKGIDEAAAKAMGLAACNAFLAANGTPAFNTSGQRQHHQANANDNGLDNELPE